MWNGYTVKTWRCEFCGEYIPRHSAWIDFYIYDSRPEQPRDMDICCASCAEDILGRIPWGDGETRLTIHVNEFIGSYNVELHQN